MNKNGKEILPVKTENALVKVNRNLRLTDKLISLYFTPEQKELIEFLVKYSTEEYSNFSLRLLSKFFPISVELLERYKHEWFWRNLSRNAALPWTAILIEKYEGLWDWHVLSVNEYLPWNVKLIEKYKDKWDWDGYKYISPDLVHIFQRHASPFDSLTIKTIGTNKALPWSIELIKKYEDKWDWEDLSYNKTLPWSTKLIERFEDKWSWEALSSNKALPLSVGLLESYEDKWHWRDLSWNDSLPWNIEVIEKYRDKLYWGAINLASKNEIPAWFIELIEGNNYGNRYTKNWIWLNFVNPNGNINYSNDWIWRNLSENKNLPWSIELINKYEDKWSWKALSSNEALPWSIELIKKYEDKWDWEDLRLNKALPWSTKLIERFENKWNWNYNLVRDLYQKIAELHINDKVVEEVMKRIEKKGR